MAVALQSGIPSRHQEILVKVQRMPQEKNKIVQRVYRKNIKISRNKSITQPFQVQNHSGMSGSDSAKRQLNEIMWVVKG